MAKMASAEQEARIAQSEGGGQAPGTPVQMDSPVLQGSVEQRVPRGELSPQGFAQDYGDFARGLGEELSFHGYNAPNQIYQQNAGAAPYSPGQLGGTIGKIGAPIAAMAAGSLAAIPPVISGPAAVGASSFTSDLDKKRDTGQPITLQDLMSATIPAAVDTGLAAIPWVKGGSMMAQAGKNALVQGAAGGGSEAVHELAHGQPLNPQAIGTSAAVGALPGAGLGVGGHVAEQILKGHAGKVGEIGAPGSMDQLGQAGQAGQPVPMTSVEQALQQAQVAPDLGMRDDFHKAIMAYAQQRATFPGSEKTKQLAKTMQSYYGVDPEQWITQNFDEFQNLARQQNAKAEMAASQAYTQNQFVPELEGRMAEAQRLDPNQQFVPNIQKTAGPAGSRIDPTTGQTVLTGSVEATEMPTNPHQDAMNKVLSEKGTLSMADVQDWLNSAQQQNEDLSDTIDRFRARKVVPEANVDTPNADRAAAQLQAADVETAQRSLAAAKQLIEASAQGQVQLAAQALEAFKQNSDDQQRAVLEYYVKALAQTRPLAEQQQMVKTWDEVFNNPETPVPKFPSPARKQGSGPKKEAQNPTPPAG